METKPALDLNLVQEFVGNAHGNLERVKELLNKEPNLLNATHGIPLIIHAEKGGDDAKEVLEYLKSL